MADVLPLQLAMQLRSRRLTSFFLLTPLFWRWGLTLAFSPQRIHPQNQFHHDILTTFWRKNRQSNSPVALFQQNRNDAESQIQRDFMDKLRERAKFQALVNAALDIDSSSLVTVQLAGKAALPSPLAGPSVDQTRLCVVLTQKNQDAPNSDQQPCLMVPLLRDGHLKPIEAAHARLPLSNPLLLRLNSLVVNRDGGLWDNIPWSFWTIDPRRTNYDAAGNPVNPKFHVGKRDAYNVMLGKDWFTYQSSSKAVSLLAQQLRDAQRAENNPQVEERGQQANDSDFEGEQNQSVLARRLLELQIREVEMDIAELDYQLAVEAATLDTTDISLEFQREELQAGLDAMKGQLQELTSDKEQQQQQGRFVSKENTAPKSLIQRILYFVEKREAAPYRGATGYAPYQARSRDAIDTDTKSKQFTSPYGMLVDIIENQLKAQIIGLHLENTSLLGGTITLGGVVVLQRKTAQNQVSIEGRKFFVGDEGEDYGNEGVQGGETYVVDCEADEALGLSLVCDNVPLQMEESLWQRCSIVGEPDQKSPSDRLAMWQATGPELSVLLEGQASEQSETSRVAPIRIPQSTLSLYDSIFLPQGSSDSDRTGLFPTDNPIRTLAELDNLSDQEKAQTLLSMSNFQGRLPRPRTLKQTKNRGGDNPLDELLLPRIDESVRRQYLIRKAKEAGDEDLVRELERSKSNRQRALEAAENARALGQEDSVQKWEQDADLYGSLRADVTQDEGSYSRFLDRDEWYERERRQTASRVNKKKFGTLLDGIE